MKAALMLALLISTAAVIARAETATAPTLKSCNKEADAKGLTGKTRADYIKSCLAGKA